MTPEQFEKEKPQLLQDYCHLFIKLKQNIYLWGKGWVVSNEKMVQFDKEVLQLLSLLGFTPITEALKTISSASMEGFRGMENIYFHPMEFVGAIKKENVPSIVETIKNFKSDLFSVESVREGKLNADRPTYPSVYYLQDNLKRFNQLTGK